MITELVLLHHLPSGIQTAAMDMLGGSGIGKQCRKVEIMADAAYAILKQPTSFTGQFVIDEDILRKEGIKEFDVYAVEPGWLRSINISCKSGKVIHFPIQSGIWFV